MKTILTTIFLALICIKVTFSQNVDSLANLSRLGLIMAEEENFLDSLEQAFLSQPRYFSVKFEKNGKTKNLNKKINFYIIIDDEIITPQKVETNIFLVPEEGDSICFVLNDRGQVYKYRNYDMEFVKYGADLKFGLITNLERLRRQNERKKKNGYYNEFKELGIPYLEILENEEVKTHSVTKQLESIDFLVVKPRRFSNGVFWHTINYKLKNRSYRE